VFDYTAEAELFSRSARKKTPRQPLGYKRFARAADAIRFAIGELPLELLVGTFLEVGEKRFQSREYGRRMRETTIPWHDGFRNA
jgi:hypothetical protein